MPVSRNALFGVGSSIWTLVIGLAVVPQYLRLLGIESYGLIGFFATYQAALALLDLGLSPSVSREVSRYEAQQARSSSRSLLRTYSLVYWALGALVAGVTLLTAPLLGRYWLKADALPVSTIVAAIALMGAITGLRWPIGLYGGVLQGVQKTAHMAVWNAVFASIGSLGAIAALRLITPSIEVYFAWQVGTVLIQVIVMRQVAWRALAASGRAATDFGLIRKSWRFSAGMAGVAVTAIIFMQLDKIVLSRLLDLTQFGYYALATLVVSATYRLTGPIYQAVAPRLSQIVVHGPPGAMAALYTRGSFVLSCLLFPASMALAVAAEPLIRLWTGDAAIAARTGVLVSILAVGSALDGAMTFPAALQFAHGMTRLPLMVNLWSLVVQVPATIVLSLWLGPLGAALAWLLLHTVHFVLGISATHTRLMPEAAASWLRRDFGLPFAVSVVFGGGAFALNRSLDMSPAVQIGLTAVVACGALAASLWTSPYSAAELREALHG